MVARVIVETSVEQMGLTDLDWTALVARHELLERKEAKIPTITFLIRYEFGNWRRILKHWANFELPDASINIAKSVERSPIFQMFRLVGGQRVLSDVSDQISIAERIVMELGLVVREEQIQQLRLFPHSIGSQDVVVFVLVPVNVSDAEVIIL